MERIWGGWNILRRREGRRPVLRWIKRAIKRFTGGVGDDGIVLAPQSQRERCFQLDSKKAWSPIRSRKHISTYVANTESFTKLEHTAYIAIVCKIKNKLPNCRHIHKHLIFLYRGSIWKSGCIFCRDHVSILVKNWHEQRPQYVYTMKVRLKTHPFSLSFEWWSGWWWQGSSSGTRCHIGIRISKKKAIQVEMQSKPAEVPISFSRTGTRTMFQCIQD